MTCGEIVTVLGRCDLTLGELGYLPDGLDDFINLRDLCPYSCGSCQNPRLTPYKCHDFPAVESLSGMTCPQVVSMSSGLLCSSALTSFGYKIPAAMPESTTLASLCAESCGNCARISTTTTSTPSDMAKCVDSDWVYGMSGMECPALVKSKNCNDLLIDMGFTPPDLVPLSATLSQACPKSCESCSSGTATGVCKDSEIVQFDLGQTCTNLITTDGCATKITSSSLIDMRKIPVAFADTRIGELCRLSCDYCSPLTDNRGESGSVKLKNCQDHEAVHEAGYTCGMFLQYAPDGCLTPLVKLLGSGNSLPNGVPLSTTIQDACPKTCGICRDDEQTQPEILDCEDSPILTAVNLSCGQVIQMGGGNGKGCDTLVVAIAGKTPMATMLPATTKISDLCKRSCLLCSGKFPFDDLVV